MIVIASASDPKFYAETQQDLEALPNAQDKVRYIRILGVPVSVIDLNRVATLIENWPDAGRVRTVFFREVASLMAAVAEPRLAALHERADLVVADGTPLVWVARMRGCGREIGRVPGADLIDIMCKQSLTTGHSHYFYGGKPGIADEMVARLRVRYPGLKVVGTFSPPMRIIGADFEVNTEIIREIEHIKATNPDFIWVGISSPKQEYWMMEATHLMDRGVLLGVGAAFDFHSGAIKRAPDWMKDNGLEWLHRLVSEPRRLWKRYLMLAPQFVWLVLCEQISFRRERKNLTQGR